MAGDRYMEQGYKALNQRYLLSAISFFRRALSLNPHNDEACAAIGTCYLLGKHYKEAQKYFGQALLINPRNASARESLEAVHEALGIASPGKFGEKSSDAMEEGEPRSAHRPRIEVIARLKKGEDTRILACPYCGSLFFRDNIHAWLAEYRKCPACARPLTAAQLQKRDWNTYKNERCAIDMIRFDMKR